MPIGLTRQALRENYLSVFFFILLAYYSVGYLAMLLAIPPGYATAIWPSAGIALAAMLLAGYRYWPAVALASFSINAIEVPLDQGVAAFFAEAWAPALIGLGAATQAVVGAWVLKRVIGYPLNLDTARSVLIYIVLICGVASVISASVAVSTLWLAGKLESNNYLYNWATWWVGDGLGIMLVATLMFVFFAEPRGIWRSRAKILPVALLLASVVVVVMYVFASRWESTRQQQMFERHAEQIYLRAEILLHSYFEGLYAAQSFLGASEHVNRDEFYQFVGGLLDRNPGFQGVAWAVVMPHQQREAFERQLSLQMGEPKVVTEADGNGTRMLADRRDTYVVIKYIAPEVGNEAALGYDISSNPLARKALLAASDHRQPAATAPLTLVQETGQQAGVVVYFPVFRAGVLSGYISGVFRVENLMHALLVKQNLNGLALTLTAGDELIFEADSLQNANKAPLFVQSWPIHFADQQWRLTISGSQRFLADSRSIMPWGVLAAGMLFVGLLGMSLLVLTGAKYHSDESSVKLQAMVERLQQTQGQLVESEKMAALGGLVAGFAHELNTPIGIAITASSTLKSDIQRIAPLVAQSDQLSRDEAERTVSRLMEASSMVLESLQRSGNLISSFKQVSVDQASADVRKINLHDYLHDILLHLAPSCRSNGHDVSLDCPRDIYIHTVPGGLTQVVVNLVNNSLGHAFPGDRQGRIQLRVRRDGPWVVLDVADDGVGMSPEVREKVFEPFFTTRRGGKHAGSGLGLHLVYNVVRRQLGGEISVVSTPGEGSTFTVQLPLMPQHDHLQDAG